MKQIILVMIVTIGIVACNDVETLPIKQAKNVDLNLEEQNVFNGLLELGLSKEISNKLILEVVRPQETLETTYQSQLMIENEGLFKNGRYHLIDGPGPGESGGPLADKCMRPGKKCRVSNKKHEITQLELDIFFPDNGLNDLYSVVQEDGSYQENHIYSNYLSVIYND